MFPLPILTFTQSIRTRDSGSEGLPILFKCQVAGIGSEAAFSVRLFSSLSYFISVPLEEGKSLGSNVELNPSSGTLTKATSRMDAPPVPAAQKQINR